jgi:hypothetical protein
MSTAADDILALDGSGPRGMYEVEFDDGSIRFIDLKRHIVDGQGHPIYFEDWTGKLYNCRKIISIRKGGGEGGKTNRL